MPNFKLKQTSEQVQKAIDNALYPDKELTKEGVPADSKSVGIEIKKNSIHIGTEAPTGGEKVWIDTDEEPDESDGTQIDVIAQPGQIIAVKEVDANGKPTKWEAIDLPEAKEPETPDFSANEGETGYIKNRTHYVDEKGVIHKLPNMYIDAEWMATKEDGGAGNTVFIPEQTVADGMWTNLQGAMTESVVYAVEVNGILYRCECRNYDGTLYLGNGTLLGGTEHNDEPFCIAWMGGTAKSGQFYTDGTLDAPIGIKVSEWIDDIYNTLPEEFLPPMSWNNLTDRPVVDGVGESFFTHTATFATDAAAKNGVQVPDASVTAILNTVYWLDVNGELIKCHWERVSFSSSLYDEDGNQWASYGLGGVYVYAQTAGTYTFTLHAPADTPMFDPKYLPPNIAKKADVKVDEDLLDELLEQYVENNGNGGSSGETEPPTGGGTSIDVTAEVGQTIVVKEVDANGKPTKWESADYPPAHVLFGEVVLTSANCSLFASNGLKYNEELTTEMESIMELCENHFGLIMVEVSIADFCGKFSAQYIGESITMDAIKNIQFSLIQDSNIVFNFNVCDSTLVTNFVDVIQAVLGGYPMTLKIYGLR